MKSERIALDECLHGPDAPLRAAALGARIRAGAVFVYPTETIYGIGGMLGDTVREGIHAAKKRPPENPMILLSNRRDVFDSMGLVFPPAAQDLAEAFWPGNLTLVLPDGRGGTVGIRVSDHPAIEVLCRDLEVPIFSTSANESGLPYNPSPDAIWGTFDGSADFMLDAGLLPPSLPSTLVSVDEANEVTVLREGAITRERILSITNKNANANANSGKG